VSEAPAPTILVAEDEPGIRALVRKILRRQGYRVLEAADGEEALRTMREHSGSIDLLITDVMMPGWAAVGSRAICESNGPTRNCCSSPVIPARRRCTLPISPLARHSCKSRSRWVRCWTE